MKLILNNTEGIKEDEDLKVSYKGLEEDLATLKADGWIRVIKCQKELVLFPLNKDDVAVEVKERIGSKIQNLLADIWDKEVSIIDC